MRNTVLGLVFGVLLSSPAVAAPPIPQGLPDWLDEALRKETDIKPAEDRVSFADGMVSFLPPAPVSGVLQQVDNHWYLTMDLQSDAPLECWIYTDPVDPGASTVGVADSLINMMAQQNGGLNSKALLHTEVASIDEAPTLAVYWLYTLGSKDKPRVSLAKVSTAVVKDVTFICSHSSVGYFNTFEKAFADLVSSVEIQRERSPYYESLYLMAIQGQPLGYSYMSMSLDADGDTQTYVNDVLMLPVDAQNVSSSDSASMVFSRPDGTLINQVSTTVENGNVTTELNLDPVEGGWQVHGTFQGKELSTQIESEEPILSDLGQFLVIKDMVDGKHPSTANFPMWLTDVDPTRFTKTTVDLAESRRQGALSMGGLKMQIQLNEESIMTQATTDAAGTEISMQLVWEAGSPFRPNN